MSFDPATPYDTLPPLPPAMDTETAPILKQCLKASRALAELKGAGGLIPDQAILINAVPLQEAQASSEIENIFTTQDSLFRAAIDESKPVAHYQFEAIHPFTDGNGRTGRILNILYLIHAGLLDIPVLYLSRYLIQQKAAYYRSLHEVTVGQDWEAWICFMLQGVEETARWTTDMIRSIRTLLDQICRTHRQIPTACRFSSDLSTCRRNASI